MSLAIVGILLALLIGGLRAVELWRAGGRIDVVNVAVVTLFAQGRAEELPRLLRDSGPAVYLGVATAMVESTRRFVATQKDHTDGAGGPTPLRVRRAALVEHVERDARAALIVATRQLRRYSWLDTLTVVCLAYASVQVAVYGNASTMLALGMVGGTLLWLSNVWSARHAARRLAVGATALVDGIARALDGSLGP